MKEWLEIAQEGIELIKSSPLFNTQKLKDTFERISEENQEFIVDKIVEMLEILHDVQIETVKFLSKNLIESLDEEQKESNVEIVELKGKSKKEILEKAKECLPHEIYKIIKDKI